MINNNICPTMLILNAGDEMVSIGLGDDVSGMIDISTNIVQNGDKKVILEIEHIMIL